MRIEGEIGNQTIYLTEQEKQVIEESIDIIVEKYLSLGNDPKTVDREFTRWALLGTLRVEGLDAVKQAAADYKPYKAK